MEVSIYAEGCSVPVGNPSKGDNKPYAKIVKNSTTDQKVFRKVRVL